METLYQDARAVSGRRVPTTITCWFDNGQNTYKVQAKNRHLTGSINELGPDLEQAKKSVEGLVRIWTCDHFKAEVRWI